MAVFETSAPPQAAKHPGYVSESDALARIVRVGVASAVIAVTVQTAAHLTNAFFLDYAVRNMDADADGNALSWAASVTLFTAALAAFVLSMLPSVRSRHFIGLGGILAFFSLDEVAAIHEKFASITVHSLDVPLSVGRAVWPVLYLPLLVFVATSLWRLAATSPSRIRSVIVLGLALLVAAVGAEATSALWWREDSRPLADDLEVAAEEGAELAGWILIGTGLVAIVYDRLLRAGEWLRRPPSVERL
jgi:hypothetical protein